jgi:hypothetical protein
VIIGCHAKEGSQPRATDLYCVWHVTEHSIENLIGQFHTFNYSADRGNHPDSHLFLSRLYGLDEREVPWRGRFYLVSNVKTVV